MVEVSQVIIAAFVADMGYLLICFSKKFCRYTNPYGLYIIHECLIGLLPEIPAEGTWLHKNKGRSLLQAYT